MKTKTNTLKSLTIQEKKECKLISQSILAMTPNYQQMGQKYSIKEVSLKNKLMKYYEFIPNTSYEVATILKRLFKTIYKKKYPHINFLDVGCGPGNILAIASILGYNVKGIEYETKYKKFVPNRFAYRVLFMDAFDYNKYDSYDVIYFYQPLVQAEAMSKLLYHMNKTIKVGTYIIAFHSGVANRYPKSWKHIEHNKYRYPYLFIKT